MGNSKKKGRNSSKKKKSHTVTSSGDADGNGNSVGVAAKKKGMAETTMETAMSTCTHGIATIKNLDVALNCQNAIDEWMHFLEVGDDSAFLNMYLKKHEDLMKGPDFILYLFGYCTDSFLNHYGSEDHQSSSEVIVRHVLRLGFIIKYGGHIEHTASIEDFAKHIRDIKTHRGLIKCLARETLPFCRCMEHLNSEAKTMEKLGVCSGCNQEFLKQQLRRCSRCLHAQYCSKECLKESWSFHKTYCLPVANALQPINKSDK